MSSLLYKRKEWIDKLASITKRGKTWQYAVSHYVDGKSRPIRKGGFRTKAEAVAAAQEVEMRLRKGGQVITKNQPFSEYFLNWIEIYKTKRHYTTYNSYLRTQKRVKNYFNDTPIQKINREMYQRFINQVGEGLSKESVRKINTHIRACVKDAILDGLITNDFTYKVELHYTVKAKDEIEKYLNYEEGQKLYEHLLTTLDKKDLSHYMILLALVTGARYQEIVGLTDKDFDFKNKMLNIEKTWKYKSKDPNEFGELKADSKPRKIKVDEDVMEKFKELIGDLPKLPFDLVFFSSKSKKLVITNNAVNKALNRMLEKLDIEKVTFHSLRHTHCSSCLYDGCSIQTVSERVGHADIATTYNTYTHVLKELKQRDEKIATQLFKKKKALRKAV